MIRLLIMIFVIGSLPVPVAEVLAEDNAVASSDTMAIQDDRTAPASDGPVPSTPNPDDVLPVLASREIAIPAVQPIGFEHPGAHCRFLRETDASTVEAEPGGSGDDEDDDSPSPVGAEARLTSYKTVYADPDTVFFTERRFDGLATIERGYARIDGLLRELAFIDRDVSGAGEARRYRTLGPDPVMISLEFHVTERQAVLTLVAGQMIATRGESARLVLEVSGLCGPDAANRSVK